LALSRGVTVRCAPFRLDLVSEMDHYPRRVRRQAIMTGGGARYLLICNTSDGLIAQLNGVVVQLQLARRLGLEPIVYLPQRSYMFGGPNPYFEAGAGPNVWDYYYEPIGPSGDALAALVKEGRVLTLSTASELARLYRWTPASWFMNPFGYYRSVENTADGPYPEAWWSVQRDKARLFLNDGTVRFKTAITHAADLYIEKFFSENTLGLQLRGSDKFDFGVGANLSRKVLPEEYRLHIDRYLAAHPECTRIFVATDQRQWLKTLEAAYPGKILSYSDKSLSDTGANRFHEAGEKAARGLEVVMDTLILSRCSYLLKCHAAVGEMALTLNPKLDFIDLNYALQPFEAKSRAQRFAFAPLMAGLSALWGWLSESGGFALAKVTAIADGEVQVDGGRALYTKTSAHEKAPRPPLLSRRFVSDGFDWALRTMGAHCFAYAARSISVARLQSPGP
jgi:hypothetical protein